jgi:HPt (histidine-containing phosphotransfer) domain-containing protein
VKSRILLALLAAFLISALTWVWGKTRSVQPYEHARFDAALRELRSLDRTINQDVLRARYQLIDSYDPVLESYRRIEELEAIIARPLSYLTPQANHQLAIAVRDYRSAVTLKQDRIERFKYRTAELMELLNYLPGAGTGVAQVCIDQKLEALAQQTNDVLKLTLLYNLTSSETYAKIIERDVLVLSTSGSQLKNENLKRRIHTLAIAIRRLLNTKPQVDRLLTEIFAQPVTVHENKVAEVYALGYAEAERSAQGYRSILYVLSMGLGILVAIAMFRLRRSARALAAANATLEERVTERTLALHQRNEEMRLVLDNVEQALFTVDLEGRLARERSSIFEVWFKGRGKVERVWEIFAEDPAASSWLRLGWDQLRDGILPLEAILDQLPRQAVCRSRHYQIAYIPIEAGLTLEKMLLVVSDVTTQLEQARREAEQQELGTVFRHIHRDRSGFLEFFSESQRLVDTALAEEAPQAAMRALHTLKGNASVYGVVTLTALCGELESRLLERGQPLTDEDRIRLRAVWEAFSDRVQDFTETTRCQVELTQTDLELLRRAISSGARSDDVLRMLRNLEREPSERRLTRLSEQTKALAKRLGKGDVVVVTESNDVRLAAERWAPFWAAFVHVIRNALDHGIETAEERVARGKAREGLIRFATKLRENRVEIEIQDDGRGIDWDAVRSKARDLGKSAETETELAELLFRGGLSTKGVVTEYSGRGTGISACHAVCVEMGGTLELESTFGEGTRVKFSIPSDDATVS